MAAVPAGMVRTLLCPVLPEPDKVTVKALAEFCSTRVPSVPAGPAVPTLKEAPLKGEGASKVSAGANGLGVNG